MRTWYHTAKREGLGVPKILGLSASIVVKSVKREEFQKEKARLEKVLDAKVETCDGISMETFVNFATESVALYSARLTDSQGITQFVSSQVYQAKVKLLKIKSEEILALKTKMKNENNRSTAEENLLKDHKFFSNFILGSTEALLSLGLYSLVAMEASLLKELRSKCSRTSSLFYDLSVRGQMQQVTEDSLAAIFEEAKKVFNSREEVGKEKIVYFTSAKVMSLVGILGEQGRNEDTTAEPMRCIVFVERKLTATALQLILSQMEIPSVLAVGHVFSCNSNRNVKEPQERVEINSEKRRMNQTLQRFRTGEINVLVSTSVVEEGIDVPSCNLVIKFDFPQSFRSYIQSKGRARKKNSRYILMVEEGDSSKLLEYKSWMDVYEMSIRECHNTEDYNNNTGHYDLFEEEEAECYTTSVARVSGSHALNLLQHYLQKIPVDRFTRLTAAWKYKVYYRTVLSDYLTPSPPLSLAPEGDQPVAAVPRSWSASPRDLQRVPSHSPAASQDAAPSPSQRRAET